MSKVTAVKPIFHGHTSVELDDGITVVLTRGTELPKVGHEYLGTDSEKVHRFRKPKPAWPKPIAPALKYRGR